MYILCSYNNTEYSVSMSRELYKTLEDLDLIHSLLDTLYVNKDEFDPQDWDIEGELNKTHYTELSRCKLTPFNPGNKLVGVVVKAPYRL